MAITAGDWPLVPGARAFARIPAATLSAASFSARLKAGAEIATISTNLPGAVVEAVAPNDGRLILSSDKTKLLRGLAALSGDAIEVSIFTSHPKALQSPRETKLTLEITKPAGGIIEPPSGLEFTPSITLTRQANGNVTHDFTIDAAKPAYARTIYVGAGGDNTKDGLTYANRLRSLKTAVENANTSGQPTRILADPGYYKFSNMSGSAVPDCFGAVKPIVDLVIEPSGPGKIISLADQALPAYAATASDPQVFVSTYTAQVPGPAAIDFSKLNAKGRPQALRRAFPANTTEATIAAALQARHAEFGVGALFLDTANKKMYLRTFDGRAPDAAIATAYQNVNRHLELASAGKSYKLWMDRVEIWMGQNPLALVSDATGNPTAWGKDCAFNYSGGGHGVNAISGGGTVNWLRCDMDDNMGDGVDYNGINGSASFVGNEVECSQEWNGWAQETDGSYNGSSAHANCRLTRVNCSTTKNANRPIHDIQNVRSWMVGCVVGPNRPFPGAPTVGPYASITSGYQGIANDTRIFLDSCSLSPDNSHDFSAIDGGQIFYTRMRTPRTLSHVSGSGSAVQEYAS